MKYISAIAACLYDSTGTIIGAIETIRDITTLKQAEEALLVANNKLNLLSSITRHDILNKIMISKAYLSFIEEIDLNPDQKTYMDAIKRSLSEIEHFVSFSKTYQELGMKVPEWQDVGEIFRRAEKEIDTGNITVNIAISGIFILVDPLFEKVCYNLIENAIRHGEKLTRIDITSYEASTGLLIKIKDDGVGIPDDQKKLIFERGFGKNTGYGLFLTREILSISSITISEQGSFGDGCLFVIDVPKGKYHIDEQS
jgi:signal transduction histidine kinase